MDYRQLLDPKGQKSKKKTPSYGPQQSRKLKPSEVPDHKPKLHQFDPKLLLNPKAVANSSRASSATPPATLPSASKMSQPSENEANDEPGQGSILERLHGVEKRDSAPPATKRKSMLIDSPDEDDEERRKAKAKFNGPGGSGMLGQEMKAEREKYADASRATIDLTNDEDDDVVFVSEVCNDNSTQEVCLGKLHAQAHTFRIPASPRYRQADSHKELWPRDRINYKRLAAQNTVIDLYERAVSDSMIGTKFGNLEPKVASALCPLLDGNAVNKFRIKLFLDMHPKKPGEHPNVRVSKFVPISIMLYSPRKFTQAIGRHLSQKQLFLQQPEQVDSGIEIDNPHQPKLFGAPDKLRKPQSHLATMVVRTQEEMNRDALDMFDSLTKSEDLPEKDHNADVILTDLMSHQKQALHFLAEHESGGCDGKDFSLWKPRRNRKGQDVWMNIITGHELSQPPQPVRGGILADMMGLGKTLSILSLIAHFLGEAETFGNQKVPQGLENVKRNAKTTLIICPKSVIGNWQTQIKEHVKSAKLKFYLYHGPNRMQDLDELAKHEVILTSYSTAQAEFSDTTRKRKALASMNWFRIVLDEAHQIRNSTTQISKACCALSAERRWAVTGTPVQNRLDDLGALIRFLRIKPFDEDTSWAQYITSPFRAGNENVLPQLRLLVDSVTLRRLKDRIGLTEREEKLVRLDFTDEELVVYSQFSQQANEKLRIMMKDNNRLQGNSYAHILRALGRLRALCAHGREMLSEEDQRELEGLTLATAIDLGDEPNGEPDDTFISSKHAYETFHMMSETEANICIGCSRRLGGKKVSPEAAAELSGDEGESESESESDTEELSGETVDEPLAYLNPCYHLICPECKEDYTQKVAPRLTQDAYHHCIYCEQYIRYGLFEISRLQYQKTLEAPAAGSNAKKTKWDEHSYSGAHTKVKALIQDLKDSEAETALLPDGEPPIRSVVFSSWTSYLDLIEYALERRSIASLRLDGKMSIKARSRVMHAFATDPTVAVLLVSIKAGGQGLNFTAANKVYMMEPQFNPGVEQQAIDRVHRLGQKRDVHITHYVMRESIEEKILMLQEKKKDLARLTMERKISRSEEAKKRIEDLKELFR